MRSVYGSISIAFDAECTPEDVDKVKGVIEGSLDAYIEGCLKRAGVPTDDIYPAVLADLHSQEAK